MKKATEFLERFYDLINKKQTGTGFIGIMEELAADVQEALNDAYQAQYDLERAKEMTV